MEKTSKRLASREMGGRHAYETKDRANNDLTSIPQTTKYNLVKEVTLRVHDLETNAPRNIWEKLRGNSRFTWNWDSHTIILGEEELYSKQTDGVFANPIPYGNIETATAVTISHLPFHYVKICTNESSFLVQTPDIYQRDRLIHSIQWKKNVYKYEKILYAANRSEVILQELQNLVKMTLEGPLHVDDTHNTLLKIVSNLLVQNQDILNTLSHESLIKTLAPLFKENQPSIEICNFFTKHCRDCPRSRIVIDIFTPMVQRILKYNTNFGKNIWLRTFVKEYIQALNSQNDGETAVRAFVHTMHGPLAICPHKRILNNLVSVCLSAIYGSFSADDTSDLEQKNKWGRLEKSANQQNPKCWIYGNENCDVRPNEHLLNNTSTEMHNISLTKFNKNIAINENSQVCKSQGHTPKVTCETKEENINLKQFHDEKIPHKRPVKEVLDVETLLLFGQVLDEISTVNDWLPGLAVLLQPIPFQSEIMEVKKFVRYLIQIIKRMADDGRDQVVWCLLSSREQKDGWVQVFNPQSEVCDDDGKLFIEMTEALLKSAKISSKVKKLVSILIKTCLNAVLLLALRESAVMIEVLCLTLEYELVVGKEEVQIVSTLRSTTLGKSQYERLCEQETVLRQKSGPDEYTLPPQSTDHDLVKFLTSGSYGNLKNLNLSFTRVTCKSAEIISRLPALQHLNLWSSNMQDIGLRRLCESLNLKSLNLCETQVTDESIICLKEMTNLTDLNLNSTPVTDIVYQELRDCLPNLVSCDVAYTEVWPQTNEPVQNNDAGVDNDSERLKKLIYMQNI